MTAFVVLLFFGGRLGRRAGPTPPAFSRVAGARGRRAGPRVRFGLTLALAAFGPGLLTRPGTGRADEPVFTEAYLADPANVALGRQLFKQQCARCHGRAAYPGKAPRLKPKRMDPDDIYAKVTYGYGRMPAWEEVFTDAQRMAITAYLKSRHFSN